MSQPFVAPPSVPPPRPHEQLQSEPRRDFGWPPWSLARLRRFVIGAVITVAVTVTMFGGLAGGDAPPPRAVAEAHLVFFPAMLGVVGAILSSVLERPPERVRWLVLRAAAAVALLAGPLRLAWVAAHA
jgi:hypothetical protein